MANPEVLLQQLSFIPSVHDYIKGMDNSYLNSINHDNKENYNNINMSNSEKNNKEQNQNQNNCNIF